jgi:hypothetical protein
MYLFKRVDWVGSISSPLKAKYNVVELKRKMDFCPSGKEMCANSLKYMHYVKASKVVCETLSRLKMNRFFGAPGMP